MPELVPLMGFDNKFLNLEYAIRTYGPKKVQGQYVRKREEALDRGDQDEADHWETRRQSVDLYVSRRRFRYNRFSFFTGSVLALLPTGYVWIQEQEAVSAIFTFIVLSILFYLAVRFFNDLVVWAAGALILSAFGSLGWQLYAWLQETQWPRLSVSDAFVWTGLRPSFVANEGWDGVSEILNAAYRWIFDLSLPLGCLILGMIFAAIFLYIEENLDLPKSAN